MIIVMAVAIGMDIATGIATVTLITAIVGRCVTAAFTVVTATAAWFVGVIFTNNELTRS